MPAGRRTRGTTSSTPVSAMTPRTAAYKVGKPAPSAWLPTRTFVAAEARNRPIRELLPPALALYLPLDRARRTDHAVRLALLARSGTGPVARALAAEHYGRLRARLGGLVANGKVCGEVDADADEAAAAHELVSLATGLADQPFAADRGRRAQGQAAVRLLEDAVARTFAHPCRRAAS